MHGCSCTHLKDSSSIRITMAEFSHFTELPKELQLQIWEAAIPQSPSVHFLSYPPRYDDDEYDEVVTWQSELINANRTINIEKDPETGELSKRTRTWGCYSSYFANLALLHACQESRRVCLAHTASRNTHGNDPSSIFITDHYTINLATDIICIQDPDPRFPWNKPRCITVFPELLPLRIALERRQFLECSGTGIHGNWITELGGGIDADFGGATSLCDEDGEPSLKVIYLLDYDIQPKYAVVAGAPEKNHDGINPRKRSGIESDDWSAAELPDHTSKHNGKFDGHGVTFYALSANIKEICTGWFIPKESRDFYYSVLASVSHRYGFEIVNSLEEAMKGDYKICIEFLACVKA